MKTIRKRRKFIKDSAVLAASGLLVTQWACKQSGGGQSEMASDTPSSESSLESLDDYGLQLYTLRQILPDDPQGIIGQLAGFGYTQIEGYEGPQGIYWNMGHKQFKNFLDDVGLTMVAAHCNIDENFERKAVEAAEIGMKYLICPFIGAQKSTEDWIRVVNKFNKCGDICRENGIRFAYHNHAYSFDTIESIIPQDFMIRETNPETVDFELDIYWIVTAGKDAEVYMKKYPNRFRLCHVKDRMKNAGPEEHNASCDLGTGTINYPQILKTASQTGMKYYIVEQERYDNSTPLDSARKGAQYLAELQFS